MGGKKDAHETAEELYALYEQKMYRIAYSILQDTWQAEDAVSDAFIRLIGSIEKIRDTKSPKTKQYIIKVTRSAAIDLYRKNQRDSKVVTLITDEKQQISLAEDPIERLLSRTSSTQQMQELLACLPEKYRRVMVCRCIHELSVKETAAILEISESLVRKQYERAKKLLMKKIGEEKYVYRSI